MFKKIARFLLVLILLISTLSSYLSVHAGDHVMDGLYRNDSYEFTIDDDYEQISNMNNGDAYEQTPDINNDDAYEQTPNIDNAYAYEQTPNVNDDSEQLSNAGDEEDANVLDIEDVSLDLVNPLDPLHPQASLFGILRHDSNPLQSAPGQGYPQISSFPRGTRVMLLGISIDHNWYYVEIGNARGWMATSHVDRVRFNMIIAGEGSTASNHIRPFPNSDVSIRNLARNAEVSAMGTSGNWVLVEHDGAVGWMHSNRLREFNRNMIIAGEGSTASNHIRPFPNSDVSVRNLARNAEVTAMGTSGNWVLVEHDGAVGWMHSNRLREFNQYHVVAGEGSTASNHIRPLPSSDVSVRNLARNAEVTAMGTSGNWVLVEHEGDIGWMHSNRLREFNRYHVVAGDGVTASNHIRPLPSSDVSVRNLARNAEVIAMGTSGNWVLVEHDGDMGWMHSNRLREFNRYHVVAGDGVTASNHIRPLPNSDVSVRNLARNAEVTAMGISGNWVLVEHDGAVGWMHSNRLIVLNRNMIIAGEGSTSSNAFRHRPGGGEETEIRRLTRNVEVSALGSSGAWVLIEHGGNMGWMHSNRLIVLNRNMIIAGEGSTSSNAFRHRPGGGEETEIRRLARNVEVSALGSSGAWVLIEHGGNIGWMHSNRLIVLNRNMIIAGEGSTSSNAFRHRPGGGEETEIRRLARNVEVSALGSSGAWVLIEHGGNMGWMHSNRLVGNNIEFVTTTSGNHAFRHRPGGGEETEIRRLGGNVSVTAHGLSANGNWTFITIGNQVGWIATNRIQLPSAVPQPPSSSGMNYSAMNRRELAQEILNRHNGNSITGRRVYLVANLSQMNMTNRLSARANIQDTANGLRARTRAGEADVYLSEDLLRAILYMNDQFGWLQINTIAGGNHSAGSRHFLGRAVDFQSNNYVVSNTGQRPAAILNYLENNRRFLTQRNHLNSPYIGNSNHFHLEIWGRR